MSAAPSLVSGQGGLCCGEWHCRTAPPTPHPPFLGWSALFPGQVGKRESRGRAQSCEERHFLPTWPGVCSPACAPRGLWSQGSGLFPCGCPVDPCRAEADRQHAAVVQSEAFVVHWDKGSLRFPPQSLHLGVLMNLSGQGKPTEDPRAVRESCNTRRCSQPGSVPTVFLRGRDALGEAP